jgi:hypothetical protein
MARIIETTETAFLIEKMLNECNRLFIIVCPYFQIHERLRKIILDKLSNHNFQLHVVTREVGKDKLSWINSENVFITVVKNLHAKYYYNEKEAIITSMNLYEYSQVNNIEVGVYFNENDKEQLSFFVEHYWKMSSFKREDYIKVLRARIREAHKKAMSVADFPDAGI